MEIKNNNKDFFLNIVIINLCVYFMVYYFW